jgi:hypothetical protein
MFFDNVRTAEHWILQAGRSTPITSAYTTFAGGRVAVCFADPPEGARAVVFPGSDRLTGVVTVQDVLGKTAIERVTLLGGGDPPPGQELDTRDFVRPQWTEGRLTLVVQPASEGRLVPFESPNPTPCCADHA